MRIVPRHILAEQKARALAKVIAIVDTAEDNEPQASTKRKRNVQGDPRVLRMIPVCAVGVGGTAPGTDPYAELDDDWPTSESSGIILCKRKAG